MGMELNSAAPSAQFETPGDTVSGVIVRVEQMHQTDMETGELVYWDAAKLRPKMMIAATLHSPGHKDSDDEGNVVVYISGGRFTAVKAVTKRLDEGATLTLTFTGLSDQPPKVKGYNRAKLFSAKYVAPSGGVVVDDKPPF